MKNYTITVNGNVYEVSVEEGVNVAQNAPLEKPAAAPVATAAPIVAAAPAAAPTPAVAKPSVSPAAKANVSAASVKINSPMPGKIVGVKVSVGDMVKRGQVIVILEAMKMENEIVASSDGTVASVDVAVGSNVEAGELLATLN